MNHIFLGFGLLRMVRIESRRTAMNEHECHGRRTEVTITIMKTINGPTYIWRRELILDRIIF